MTQEALAERADISVSFLSMIERGERTAHIETLAALAEALQVPLAALFLERGSHPIDPDPLLDPIADLVDRLRLGRRDIERLLLVAKALFPPS